jgi:hypothetical protein
MKDFPDRHFVSNTTTIGLIAQEAEIVFPDLVQTSPDGSKEPIATSQPRPGSNSAEQQTWGNHTALKKEVMMDGRCSEKLNRVTMELLLWTKNMQKELSKVTRATGAAAD